MAANEVEIRLGVAGAQQVQQRLDSITKSVGEQQFAFRSLGIALSELGILTSNFGLSAVGSMVDLVTATKDASLGFSELVTKVAAVRIGLLGFSALGAGALGALAVGKVVLDSAKTTQINQDARARAVELAGANETLAGAIEKEIKARLKANDISKETAENFKRELLVTQQLAARTGEFGAGFNALTLVELSRRVRGSKEAQVDPELEKQIGRENQAKFDLGVKTQLAMSERELAINQHNLDVERITYEQYQAQRRRIAEDSYNAELDVIKRTMLEAELTAKSSSPIERASGQALRAEAQLQLSLLEQQYQSKKDQIIIDREQYEFQKNRELLEKSIAAIAMSQAEIGRGIAEQERIALERKSSQLRLERDSFAIQRASVENDFTKTAIEKRTELLKIYDSELDTLKKQRVVLEDLKSKAPDSATRGNVQLQIDALDHSARTTFQNRARLKASADPESFTQQFASTVNGLQDQWGSWAQQMASAFADTFNNAISTVSSNITGLIMATQTWGQALANIGTSILTGVINAIVQMGVRWIATQILMHTVGKSLLAASVAATAPLALAQSAVWATPATLATIASYGGAAAAAPGEIALAQGVVLSESLATFATGGRPNIGQISLVGEQGFELFRPDVPGTIVPNAASGQMAASGDVTVVLFDDRKSAEDYFNSRKGRKQFVAISSATKHEA